MLSVYGLFCFFVLSMGCIGHAGLSFLPGMLPRTNIWMRWFLALTLGLSATILVLTVLGTAGLFAFRPVFGCLAVLLALSILRLPPLSAPTKTALFPLCTLCALLAAGIAVTSHPVGIWDDTMYHLPLARHYVESGGFTCPEHLRFPLFPQNMHLLFGLGFLLFGPNTVPGDIFVQLTATFPLLLCMFGIIAASARYAGSFWPGCLGALALPVLWPIAETLGFAYIDGGMTLFCWAALLALALALDSDDKPTQGSLAVLAGIFMGMAMGTKYFGLVAVGFSGLLFLVLTRNIRAALLCGLPALLTGAFWYVRAWMISGDPIHPAGGAFFGYSLWNEQDLLIQTVQQDMLGVTKHITNLWPALQKAGVGFLAALPLLALRRNRMSPGMKLIALSSLCYFFFWFFVTQVERYLDPILPPALFLLAWLGRSLLPFRTAQKTEAVAFGVFVIMLALICHDKKTSLAAWEQHLYPKDGIALVQAANKLMPAQGTTLLQLGFENLIYTFHGKALGDHFGPYRYRDFLAAPLKTGPDFNIPGYLDFLKQTPILPPAALLEKLQSLDCRMLLVNTNLFRINPEDYRPFFDMQQTTAHGLLLTIKGSSLPVSPKDIP